MKLSRQRQTPREQPAPRELRARVEFKPFAAQAWLVLLRARTPQDVRTWLIKWGGVDRAVGRTLSRQDMRAILDDLEAQRVAWVEQWESGGVNTSSTTTDTTADD